jgi:hypothetical protein
MSPIPDDFEQLRRVLALKRYEQPPPAYFHNFSRQVIVRIEAGELGDPVAASFWSFSGGSFLQRVWATLDARPVLAGAFGVAVCGFFVVGALLSDATANPNPPTSPPEQFAEQPSSVWPQTKSDTEFSLVGESLPNYQPPKKGSLFEEIENRQRALPPQWQSRPATDLRLLIPAQP